LDTEADFDADAVEVVEDEEEDEPERAAAGETPRDSSRATAASRRATREARSGVVMIDTVRQEGLGELEI
jgi:hypothetical protein